MSKKFRNCFQVASVEPESVFLLSERESFLLNERLYQLLTPLIDGYRTDDEIVEAVLSQLLPENVSVEVESDARIKAYYALMQMEQMGCIMESSNCLPSNLEIFCKHLDIEPKEAYRRLQSTKVALKSFGSVSTSEFKTTLESLQIQVSEDAEIEVVLTNDYLTEGLETYNQEALERSHPWMLVKPVGTIVWIGPIFYPGRTGCWQCLAQRLRGNRPLEEFIQRQNGISTSLMRPLASLPCTLQTALGMAATEVLKWIVRGENKRLEGVLMTHDTISLETQNHILVKRPQCQSCGQVAFRIGKPQPVFLGRQKKTFTADGGHRSRLPEETLQKYQHHISPITGVVRDLEKVSRGLNSLTHTYVAKHHFATMFDDLHALRQNIRGRSGGKGKTDQQARASALCEAIERYSGTFHGDEIQHKGSYHLMGDKAIHPNTCMNFSAAQYKNRQKWNAICPSVMQRVPEPFDEDREIDWTAIWSLTDQDFKYLPTAYCYSGYPQPPKPDCWANSNGCAAGNTLEEAILQGFMELVERDSVALWWYNRINRPRVDLDSFDEPYFQALKDYYQTIHRDLWVLDITSDLNIPAFAAISRRKEHEVEDIIFGYGAHFDPKIAILRSLTEANQILPTVLSANADGSTQYLSNELLAIHWWKTATIQEQPYLVPDDSLAPKVCADYPQILSHDLFEDVMTCKQIVQKNGMEMLVLDQTRPDIGLKVVKVIVPGMRHFWKRLGPGRLYEVPIQLDWLKEPLKEDQLNPFPMWM